MKKFKTSLIATICAILLVCSFALVGCGDTDDGEKELTALDAPTGLVFENDAVKWNAVPNAKEYTVSVKQGDVQDVSKVVAEALFDMKDFAAGEYKVSVKANAVAGAFKESPESSIDVTITETEGRLPTVTDIVYEAGRELVSWSPVSGADFYAVEVTKGTEEVYSNAELVETEIDTTAWPSGNLVVKVQACVLEETEEIANGRFGRGNITIESMGELAAPVNLKIEGGEIKWDENNARGYKAVIKNKANGATVDVNTQFGKNSLKVAAMGLSDGSYIAEIQSTSNRHNTTESAVVSKEFTVEIAAKFLPDDIASFDGNMPRGEHGKASKVTVNGIDYARVQPTADGWGRVCSPDVTVDWDSKPVVFLEMGDVVGGYHMELFYNGNKVNCLRDTQNTESAIVDIIAQVVKEGGDAADYAGMRSVALRLGVDHSTTTTANDASADYKSVTVMYVTDYKQGLTEPTKLATPTSMTIDAFGVMSFNGVRFAKRYEVTVKNTQTNEQVGEKVSLSATAFDLKGFAAGEYELSVVAVNPLDANALDSDAGIFTFKVEELKSYTAEQISTAEGGMFVSTGNSVQAKYDSASGLSIINEPVETTDPENPEAEPTFKVKDWGAIGMKDGVAVNFTRNPIVLVTVARLEGGKAYYAKASWDGQGEFNTNNDTVADISSETVLAIRGGWNSDNNQLGVGEKEGFKFQFGVTGGGTTAYLKGIKIVQIYATGALARPETPSQLARPTGMSIHDRTTVKANAVAGNAEYAPTYRIKVAEKDNPEAVVAELTKQELPQIMLSRLELTSGKTYTVSIVAEGDTYSDDTKPFFADSEAATMDIKYTRRLVVDDFSNYTAEYVGGGNTIKAEPDGKALKISSDDGWGMLKLELLTGELADKNGLSEISALEFHFGEVTGGPAFTSRYFHYETVEDSETGEEKQNLVWKDGRGDTSVASGDIIVETNLFERVTFTTFDGANGCLLGIGFGGANSENNTRTYQITKIVIADYEEIKA